MPTKKPPNFAAWRRVLIPKKPNVKTIFVKGAGLEPATVYDPMGSHSNQLSYPLKNRAAHICQESRPRVVLFQSTLQMYAAFPKKQTPASFGEGRSQKKQSHEKYEIRAPVTAGALP